MKDDIFLKQILEDEPKRTSTFRIVPIKDPAKLETHLQYVDQMAKAIKAKGFEKRPVSTIQAASTQRLLDMTEDELIAYRNRPLPSEDQWKRESDAELLWDMHKGNTPENIVAIQSTRKDRSDFADYGDYQVNTLDPVKKEKAVKAWMETKPAPYTPMEEYKIKEGHTDDYMKEEPKKDSWFKMLKAKVFKGEPEAIEYLKTSKEDFKKLMGMIK